MCTVTFFPVQDSDYILTQNRDVSTERPKAEPPDYHNYHGSSLLYPIDVNGGGTWNAVSSTHHAFLLNGADYNYYPDFDAPKSRGSLCLDLLIKGEGFMADHNFKDYDDFTLILVPRTLDSDMDEWRWDGDRLSHRTRPVNEPYMWISRGMYSKNDYIRKSQAFRQFLGEINASSTSDISDMVWTFHHREEVRGEEGFLISRPYHLATVSVIQATQQGGKLNVRYEDRIV